MASKQVTDREKSGSAVIAVAETQAEATGAALNRALKPHLAKGESLPDIGLVMILIARAIEAAKTRMVDADAAHEAELGDDAAIRQARDEAQSALSDKLVELREVVIGVYGGATASALFSGPVPQDPVVLSRFAGEVATAMDRVKLPAPRVKGAKLDAAETAGDLRDLRAKLDAAIKDVAREVREAQATLDEKNRELGSYDELFGCGATTLTGLLRMAGKAELAAKVKPSSRRPGQTASDAGDAGGAASATGTGDK
jgi:hypothetical protein